MRRRIQLLIVIGLVMLLGLLIRWVVVPRTIASAIAPDGTQMCIVQQWGGEPFATSFVYRKPGKAWGWFYYDHEDWYWGSGHVVVDTNRTAAIFYREGKVTAEFDWATETFRLRSDRTLTGAQRYLPEGWSPSMSVYR